MSKDNNHNKQYIKFNISQLLHLCMHRGREGKMECFLCGDECESVSHVFGRVQHMVAYTTASL